MTTQPVQDTQKKTGSGWGWVLLAGLFEVGFTYALKMWQHNENYGALFLVCAILSFECLSRSLRTLPVSLAYAVWTGIGAAGAANAGLMAAAILALSDAGLAQRLDDWRAALSASIPEVPADE